MNKINFVAKDNFPISTNTYDELQSNTFLVSNLASIAGETYILKGCEEDEEGNVSDGFVVINGEVLPFIGGKKKTKITIKETIKADHFAGIDYPEAYIYRVVQLSDKGEFDWVDFERIVTNAQLKKRIDNIKGDVPGTIKEWSGLVAKIPSDYLLCDGRELSVLEYPELFDILRFTYGGNGDDVFKIPDCRGRFTVSYDNTDSEYQVGSVGGDKLIVLKPEEMPKHRHAYSDDTNALGKFPEVEDGFPQSYGYINATKSSGENSGTGTVYYTSSAGKNQAHENRPPFITFAKIIKVY